MRAARKALGLTLEDVASKVGLSVPYLSDIERGNRHLPQRWRDPFAKVLRLPVADLTPLDAPTLAVVTEALREAGGCERALGVVRELAEPQKGRAA